MILIPLGTIIECDTRSAIIKFQKIISKLSFNYNVTELLPKLTALMEDFNQGLVTEEDFLSQILDSILNEAKESNPELPDFTDNQKLELKQQLLVAWDSQIKIDEKAIELLKIIKELKQSGKEIVIYSGTNISHFNYQLNIFKTYEIDLEEADIHATFKYKTDKTTLVKKLLEIYKVSANNPCIIAVGNPEEYHNFLRSIKDDRGALEKMEQSKIAGICSLNDEKSIYVEQLTGDNSTPGSGSRLTKENLTELLRKMDEILKNKPTLIKKPIPMHF